MILWSQLSLQNSPLSQNQRSDSKMAVSNPIAVRKEQRVSRLIELNDDLKEKKIKFQACGSCNKCGEEECRKFVWAIVTDECIICGCLPEDHLVQPRFAALVDSEGSMNSFSSANSFSSDTLSHEKPKRKSKKHSNLREKKDKKEKKGKKKHEKSDKSLPPPMKTDSESIRSEESKEQTSSVEECSVCGECKCKKYLPSSDGGCVCGCASDLHSTTCSAALTSNEAQPLPNVQSEG